MRFIALLVDNKARVAPLAANPARDEHAEQAQSSLLFSQEPGGHGGMPPD
jgi:hypothetical protein